MTGGVEHAISNFVFLPGGTHPIHTQSNYVMRNCTRRCYGRHQTSQDDNFYDRRQVDKSKRNSRASWCDLDKLMLEGVSAARNRLNALGYLNLPSPVLRGLGQINATLNSHYLSSSASSLRGSQSPQGSHKQQPPVRVSRNEASTKRPTSGRHKENLLATLSRYHTIFLVDDSASMNVKGRWNEARETLSAVAATAVRFVQEGIDIYFLNTNIHLRNARTTQQVNRVFDEVRPTGACTPIEARVEALTTHHLDLRDSLKAQGLPPAKPLNLVVITDGKADDPDSLVYTITNLCERLEESQCQRNEIGIQFIQIGDNPEATSFLKMLDDDLTRLHGVKRDIVDTTPYRGRLTAEFVFKSLLGGINKRLDRQR